LSRFESGWPDSGSWLEIRLETYISCTFCRCATGEKSSRVNDVDSTGLDSAWLHHIPCMWYHPGATLCQRYQQQRPFNHVMIILT